MIKKKTLVPNYFSLHVFKDVKDKLLTISAQMR